MFSHFLARGNFAELCANLTKGEFRNEFREILAGASESLLASSHLAASRRQIANRSCSLRATVRTRISCPASIGASPVVGAHSACLLHHRLSRKVHRTYYSSGCWRTWDGAACGCAALRRSFERPRSRRPGRRSSQEEGELTDRHSRKRYALDVYTRCMVHGLADTRSAEASHHSHVA